MSLIAVISSPRKGGFGDTIAQRIIDGARSVGKEVEVVHLNELGWIRDCQNCEACKHNGGHCVLKDNLTPVIESLRDAEGLIQVTSINFNLQNGLFGIFRDRLYCYLDINSSTILPKGKKLATVVTASADDTAAQSLADEMDRMMSQHFFFESVGKMTYITWMMPVEAGVDPDVLEQAEEMGKRFRPSKLDLRSLPVSEDLLGAYKDDPAALGVFLQINIES